MAECTAALLTRLAAERPTLYALMGEMAALMLKKSHDYSSSDPEGLDNLLECEKMGIPGWKGAVIRKGDKWTRIRLYAARELLKVEDEPFEQTLLDDAIYDLLTILLYRRAREADRKPSNERPAELNGTSTWPLKEVRSGLAGLSIACAEEVLHADEYGVLTVRPAVPTPTERR